MQEKGVGAATLALAVPAREFAAASFASCTCRRSACWLRCGAYGLHVVRVLLACARVWQTKGPGMANQSPGISKKGPGMAALSPVVPLSPVSCTCRFNVAVGCVRLFYMLYVLSRCLMSERGSLVFALCDRECAGVYACAAVCATARVILRECIYLATGCARKCLIPEICGSVPLIWDRMRLQLNKISRL